MAQSRHPGTSAILSLIGVKADGQKRTHALQHECIQKDRQLRRSPRKPVSGGFFDQAASAAAFRFLRQPSRPIAPRPVAKSGSAAGNGVADGVNSTPKK